MQQDLISIIVPVYNVEKFLLHCLKTISNQTYKNIEIICINDGSTDNSLNILNEYAQKDNRIKIINKKNGGLSSARNTGLKEALGSYIFFVDSDDYIHPQTIEILYNGIKSTNTKISECNYLTISDRISTFKKFSNNDFFIINNPLKAFAEKKKNITPSVWKRLYDIEIIKNMEFVEGIVWEDIPYTIELYRKVDKISSTKTPLYFYYQNKDSISNSNYSKFKVDCHIKNIFFINNFLKDKPYERKKCIGLLIRRIINDTKKIKDKELNNYIKNNLKKLHKEKIIGYKGLPIKKIWDLWKILK